MGTILLIDVRDVLIISVSHIAGRKAAGSRARVQLRGSHGGVAVHLCTHNPTAAGIDTVHADGAEKARVDLGAPVSPLKATANSSRGASLTYHT